VRAINSKCSRGVTTGEIPVQLTIEAEREDAAAPVGKATLEVWVKIELGMMEETPETAPATHNKRQDRRIFSRAVRSLAQNTIKRYTDR
jgi:ribosomal protein L6P/L9E